MELNKRNKPRTMTAEELRKEIVRLSQSYHNLGMCYIDLVEKCDELINQFKSDVCNQLKEDCVDNVMKNCEPQPTWGEIEDKILNTPEPT